MSRSYLFLLLIVWAEFPGCFELSAFDFALASVTLCVCVRICPGHLSLPSDSVSSPQS